MSESTTAEGSRPHDNPSASAPNGAAPDSPLGQSGKYVVVARRYRPQTFDQLVGQQHIAQALVGAITSCRVGHAYLFTGARGVGKTSAARILAKALNCGFAEAAVPCNQCEACQSISEGSDVDVLEIDGASNRGIEEIRQLRQNAAIRPSRSRLKIYIIDEVHMLTKEAFNALLKILEEPPAHVKFIFATTEPNKIPVTILSRCQRYDFAGIDTQAIQLRLGQIAEAENVTVEPDALQLLAMRAAGSMRDSQSLLEQLLATGCDRVTAQDVTSMLGIAPAARLSRLVEPLIDRNAAIALTELDGALVEGAEVGQLIDQLLGYFRDVLTQAVGCDATQMLYALPGQQEEISAVAARMGVQTLLAMVQILDQTAARMRVSNHTRILAEMAIVRLCHLDDLDALAELIEQINRSPDAPIAAVSGPAATESGHDRPPRSAAPPDRQSRASSTRPESSPVVHQAEPPVRSNSRVSEPAPDAGAETTPSGESISAEIAQSDPIPSKACVQLTEEGADRLWQQAIELAAGMVADYGALADRVNIGDKGQLVVSFPERYQSGREFCERPANRSRLERALEQIAGGPVAFTLQTHVEQADTVKPSAPPPTRREKQAEIVKQPYVQRALELFDGDPGRIRYVPPEEG
jgi:DNA polymerase III subunit gamma/tau